MLVAFARRTTPQASLPGSFELGFIEEPDGLRRLTVLANSQADGCRVMDLPLAADAWVSVVRRESRMVQVRGHTVLRPDDEVLILTDEHSVDAIRSVF